MYHSYVDFRAVFLKPIAHIIIVLVSSEILDVNNSRRGVNSPWGKLAPVCANLGPICFNLGHVCANLGPVCVNLGPVCVNLGPVCGNLGPVCAISPAFDPPGVPYQIVYKKRAP